MDVNWIKEQFEWSLEKAWVELRNRVIADLKEWKQLTQNAPPFQVKLEGDNDQIAISKIPLGLYSKSWVSLGFDGDWIIMSRSDDLESNGPMKIKPLLDDKGERRFAIPLKDKEEKLTYETHHRELWQVSRMVLNGILFDSEY